jgi:asparagine synthase (glutamine-hydrolysing)
MSERLVHRGPDDDGLWVSDDHTVYLAHRRLSIIDLSADAKQPMQAYDRRFVLTYNGEIYNYRELRDACIKLGSHFNTQSDSEVIIEAYRHWGVDAFKKFRGMWAFALFDKEENKVILSRDPFAIKPLYYGTHHGRLYFASEPGALNVLGEHFCEHDLTSIHLFRESGYLERGDWTFYNNIKRFPHAHFSVIDLDKPQADLKFQRYWSPAHNTEHYASYDAAVNRCRDLLNDSIQLHLRSDVPVGSCLSGGIDSSAIVCMGSDLNPKEAFTTFTTHYPQHQNLDETQWAKKIIERNNARAFFTEPTQTDFVADLDDLLQAQGEPFGSMSIYAQYCVFKKIHETNIKVVLDGQGADEMFGGYLGFVPFYFEDLARKRRFVTLLQELFAFKDVDVPGLDIKAQLKRAVRFLFQKNNAAATSTSTPAEVKDELDARLAQLTVSHTSFESRLEDLLTNSNIPQLLRYEDRNSMHFSIESRVPFLETELVNFALSLPASFKIKRGFTKAVLRDALTGILPDDVRVRRDKLGFPAPECAWLKSGFDIEAPGPGSRQWRDFILERWMKTAVNSSNTMMTDNRNNYAIEA